MPAEPLITVLRRLDVAPTDAEADTTADGDGSGLDIPPIVARACERLADQAVDDVRTCDLARELHLSERALQYAFRRYVGVTPMTLLKLVRLERVRRELVEGDAGSSRRVGAVAAKYRFHNAGRFAALYSQVYGELPSSSVGQRSGSTA